MEVTYILDVPLTGSVKRRSDGVWVSRNDQFGFITYGATREEAIRRASEAMWDATGVLMEKTGVEGLRRWLAAKGVWHLIAEVTDDEPSSRYEVTERRELAGAGAG